MRVRLTQGFLRGPDERTKRTQFCVLAQGQTWQDPVWDWCQGLEGAKVSAAGNLAFLLEETRDISPKAIVCFLFDTLEIYCVPLVQHSLINFLLTLFHFFPKNYI